MTALYFAGRACTACKTGLSPSGGTKAEARTADYYKKRPCPELCRMCADLCAEFIAAHPEGRCGVYKEDV